MGFHPTQDKPLVFAGDKMGNLGIFDASQKPERSLKVEDDAHVDAYLDTSESSPAITSLHLHTRTISSMQFSRTNPSYIYTCSYDSSIRLLDLTASNSSEVYGPREHDTDEPLSGVEIDPISPSVLYFSRLDGYVGRKDTRSPDSLDLFQLSEKKIGGFSIHPQYPNYVATASLDRYMRLWDLRKISGKGDNTLPTMVGKHESRLSVSHAAFNSAGQIATSSYDDTIKIYSFERMGDWPPGKTMSEAEMEPSKIVKHNNQTGRWVTM